jgi:hypothetical protein
VAPVTGSLESSFIGDLVDAVTNPVALLVDGPTREARKRGEDEDFRGGELRRCSRPGAPTLTIEGGPVHPFTGEGRRTVDQLTNAMCSSPLLGPTDETFLAPLGEDVAQSRELSRRLVAHEDGLIAAAPESFSPSSQSARFSREV